MSPGVGPFHQNPEPAGDTGRVAVLAWNLSQHTATSGALCPLRTGKGAAVRTDDRIIAAAAGRNRLRASDSDRERVLDMLKTAFVQGRLAKDEFDLRVGQTLASRTWGDLRALTDAIPAWPLPQPVRKPARPPSSQPTHAVVKAVACAIISLATISIAGMPGMWTMPAPPSMTAQACQVFDGWQNLHYRGISNLNVAVADARNGSDPNLANDLWTLQQAYLRSEGVGGPPPSAAAAQAYASQVKADTALVTADCMAHGY